MAEWVSAVGTVAALFAAVWALRIQSRELALQREELSLQRKELARSVANQEQLAQVELERLLADDDSSVAVSLSGSFFRAKVDGGELIVSVENRSNWRISDLRLVFFGWTNQPDEFEYRWPGRQILAAYDEAVEFPQSEPGLEPIYCNASISILTDESIPPHGIETAVAQLWDERLSVNGYVATFVAAGRRWLATNSGGRWGEQLAIHSLRVGGPYKVAEFCRENGVRLLPVRRSAPR